MVSYFWRLQSVKKRKILIKFNARLEKRRRLLAGKRAKSNESLMEITAAKTLPAVLHYAFNFITQPVGKGKSRPVLSWPIKSSETLVKSARRPKGKPPPSFTIQSRIPWRLNSSDIAAQQGVLMRMILVAELWRGTGKTAGSRGSWRDRVYCLILWKPCVKISSHKSMKRPAQVHN